ncbi:RNA pyrophosphohydrolase [Hephaestia sp. GCM10023244]|uniref:RNA pyrophosphohydrolase n=1 Tax=unclassified Hephaestia TaxID=2631281 RepID=UPI0020772E4E|nr:RNA pyrophosphohydrolase [Hephaestia sp. MAHUQ-44]MCM8730224.1 RNA pyrophosphohydrolase [Hephaestia sp. MAHUQ-44]
MTTTDFSTLPYRPCAGVMLVNREGKVFVGQRLDSKTEAWQMPQGGIEPGEDAEAAALRELGEETGIAPDKVMLVAAAPEEFCYDLPDDLIGRLWQGRWRGQRQRWFLYRFTGDDKDVDIHTADQEFRAWRWAEPADLPEMIVPFKKPLYQRVLAAFADHLG